MGDCDLFGEFFPEFLLAGVALLGGEGLVGECLWCGPIGEP